MVLKRQQSSLTPGELQKLIDTGTSDHLAFVSAKSSERSVAETLVAMANANGGTVILGVNSKGTPQATVAPAELRDKATAAGLLSDPPLILPSPHVVAYPQPEAHSAEDGDASEDLEGASVVVVQVPAGLPHLYSVRGRYLTRTAAQNRSLTTPELRRLLLERGDSGFEESAVEGATLSELDPRKIERYLDRIGAAPDEDALHVLLARGCVAATADPAAATEATAGASFVPTVAGLLLFGRDPRRFLRSAEVICVRYAGDTMGDEFVRQDVYGSLAEQARQAETFVTSNMRRGMRIAGMARKDTAEYPAPVVREAIVNAIAHRDYSIRGEGIRVLMFSDRLEVYSPGRLPGHVTLDNLVDERYSRNEAIVAVLTDLGYIERLGYGIDRMIATMGEAGLPAPIFEETAAGFKVTLRSANVALPEAQSATLVHAPDPHVPLNDRQEAALAYVQEHSRITNSDYQALVPDVSAETIRRDLADLVEKNFLIRIGNKRATYYILK